MNNSCNKKRFKFIQKINLHALVREVFAYLMVLFYLLPFLICLVYVLQERVELFSIFSFQRPNKIYWGNFAEALVKLNYVIILKNTLIIATISSMLTALFSAMIGYVIARVKHQYFNGLYYYFLFGLLIPFQIIFVPIYQLGSSLGLVNNFFGLIFFYLASSLPMGVLLMSGFMKTIPLEIEEAALMDGATIKQTFFQVVTPMLKPAFVTLVILQVVVYWNDYLMPLLFLQTTDLHTITIAINELFEQYYQYYQTAFAGFFLSMIPMVILFLFLQKYFIKGITQGAFKE